MEYPNNHVAIHDNFNGDHTYMYDEEITRRVEAQKLN